eukprot:11645108-Ditylum_brightwellii.AAC.1
MSSGTSHASCQKVGLIWWKCCLGAKVLQHWLQFKSQVTGLPILGVLDKDEEESSEEDKDDKEKEKKDKEQSSASAVPPDGITKKTYSS